MNSYMSMPIFMCQPKSEYETKFELCAELCSRNKAIGIEKKIISLELLYIFQNS